MLSLLSILISIAIGLVDCIPFTIETSNSIQNIPDEFLSITIDAWLANDWSSFDFNSELVNNLAKGLSPAYLRYGGTNEDNTYYNMTQQQQNTKSLQDHIPFKLQYLNLTEFFQLANFVNNVGLSFVFGLDAQIRFDNGSWDPSNSLDLMNQIAKYKYIKSDFVFAFELGNEPDIYNDWVQQYGMEVVAASQMMKDFITLDNIITTNFHNAANQNNLKNTKIWGCDPTTSNNGYLQSFLETNSNPSMLLDKITWHHYYGDGSTWTVSDFTNIKTLDSFIAVANASIDIQKKYGNGVPIILGLF